jgi:hypothetical protein
MPTSDQFKNDLVTAVTFADRWLVLLTAQPATLTAAAVFAARFTGSPPQKVTNADFGPPAGGQRLNINEILYPAITGLVGPVTVSHYAWVTTSDNLVPNAGASYSNVNAVFEAAALTRSIIYTNGATPRFPAGTIVHEVRD